MNIAALGTQVEKLSKATRVLMSLSGSPQQRLVSALIELTFAFLENEAVQGAAEAELAKLRSLVSGPGTFAEIVDRLDEEKLNLVAEAFWRLDRKVMYVYYKHVT